MDVGTGFYVEKSVKDAGVFYEGKVKELGVSLGELEKIVQAKSENLRAVEDGEFPCCYFWHDNVSKLD